MDYSDYADNSYREREGKSPERDIDRSGDRAGSSRVGETKRSMDNKGKSHKHASDSSEEKQNKMPEPVERGKLLRSSAECEMPGMWKWPAVLGSDSRMLKQNEEPTDESPHQALTLSNTTTPTVSISEIRTVDNSHLFDTSHSPAQSRSRSHQASNSSDTVKPRSNAAGKAPERRSSSSSSDEDEYGEVIAPRLDLVALRQLPPRLQDSLLAMQRERDLRAARQVERQPLRLPTPQRTTPLGAHPPTDDEREYARGLMQRYRAAAAPPPRVRTRQQLNRTIAPFMEHEASGLPERESVPPPAGRRLLKKRKSQLGIKPKVAGRLASAKKWVMRVFGGKGEGDGGGQGEEGVEREEGDGEGEERGGERDVAPVAGQQMTSRGRLEGYS